MARHHSIQASHRLNAVLEFKVDHCLTGVDVVQILRNDVHNMTAETKNYLDMHHDNMDQMDTQHNKATATHEALIAISWEDELSLDNAYATAMEEIDSQLRAILEEMHQAKEDLKSLADDVVTSPCQRTKKAIAEEHHIILNDTMETEPSLQNQSR